MAHYRLNELQDATAMLKEWSSNAEKLPPKGDTGDYGLDWHDGLIARILFREAQALVGEK